MILVMLALAPAWAIAAYIYSRDKYDHEPLGLVVRMYLLGGLALLPALAIELMAARLGWPGGVFFWPKSLLYAYLIVGISEEGSKFLLLRLVAYPNKAFDEPFDGIVYAVMISMGFASAETLAYVLHRGYTVALMRMFLSVPAHACFAILMGYHAGLAKFDPSHAGSRLLTGLGLAVYFHGTFDAFLFIGKTGLLAAGALVSFYFCLRLSWQALRRQQERSGRFVRQARQTASKPPQS